MKNIFKRSSFIVLIFILILVVSGIYSSGIVEFSDEIINYFSAQTFLFLTLPILLTIFFVPFVTFYLNKVKGKTLFYMPIIMLLFGSVSVILFIYGAIKNGADSYAIVIIPPIILIIAAIVSVFVSLFFYLIRSWTDKKENILYFVIVATLLFVGIGFSLYQSAYRDGCGFVGNSCFNYLYYSSGWASGKYQKIEACSTLKLLGNRDDCYGSIADPIAGNTGKTEKNIEACKYIKDTQKRDQCYIFQIQSNGDYEKCKNVSTEFGFGSSFFEDEFTINNRDICYSRVADYLRNITPCDFATNKQKCINDARL